MEETLYYPKWYRLDNAAKIYPVVASAKSSQVFRVAITMKQNIVPDVLQQAVADCKARFPSFYVKLKRGFFWYYYEANERQPIVNPESPYICSAMDPNNNNGYLFAFFYYQNRITLEVFHSLCDGRGALDFLKAVIYHYLELLGYPMESENIVMTLDQAPRQVEIEDSYIKHYNPQIKQHGKTVIAYRTSGTQFNEEGLGIIHGKMPTEQLLEISRQNNATISEYLSALLIYCIIETGNMKLLSHFPVSVCIPVDMRKYFNSSTLRNFSLVISTIIHSKGRRLSFEEILLEVKAQFKTELTTDNLQRNLNANVSWEKNIAVKCCPLAIKWILFKIGYLLAGTIPTTMAFSNLGIITLPLSMRNHVDEFDVNTGVGSFFTNSVFIITYNGKTSIGFSRRIYETVLERTFFTFLSNQGIEVEVQSNLWENFA